MFGIEKSFKKYGRLPKEVLLHILSSLKLWIIYEERSLAFAKAFKGAANHFATNRAVLTSGLIST